MSDPNMIWAGALVAVAAMVCLAALKGWQGWLEIRRLQFQARPAADDPTLAVRIEMANLKERLRKLEAIAQGVDL